MTTTVVALRTEEAPVTDTSVELESGAPAKVLLVDDDPRLRRLVSRVLRKNGFEIMEAGDGAAALQMAADEPPDIAIVDLRMPEVDGFEVVRGLKASNRQRPVLVLSGLDEPEERVAAFDAGADDFVPKPVHMQELLRRIDAFERMRRAYREVREANERADHLRLFAAEAAALLAHDLNNGLSIASANLQFLGEALDDTIDDEDVVDALAGTRRAMRRMIGLVSNFVDIARLEDAALVPARTETDVFELLCSAAQVHDPRRNPGDRGIEVQCSPGLHANIDPMLTERVIHNLLNNATRYVRPQGLIRLDASLSKDSENNSVLVLRVGNTGDAIPVKFRELLFSKYRKGQDGKAQRGMGLYFCRLACEAHGGTIEVDEIPDFPTDFVIRLPF